MGTVGAFEKRSLMGEDDIGAVFRREELDGGQRRGDAFLADDHGGGKYNATVRHDVQIADVVGAKLALQRGAFVEAQAGAFLASDAKIQLIVLDLVVVAGDKLAALLFRVGEGGEGAFGRDGVAAFDDEGAVDHGCLLHGVPLLVKYLLEY